MIMELRHLKYFVTLAEELNFTRAAERMNIAQPPFSTQIRDLEIELGVRLFERTKRRVTITKAGKVFLAEVRLVMQQVNTAVEAVQRAGRGEVGQLVVGFNNSTSYNVLPAVLEQFYNEYPEAELVLKELTTSQQLISLKNGQIDIGLQYLPINSSGIKTIDSAGFATVSIQEEILVLALPKKHYLAKDSTVNFQMLDSELFILPPQQIGEGLYNQVHRYFRENKFSPKRKQEVLELPTVINLVASGVGVAIVPSSVQSLQREGVVYKTLGEYQTKIELGAVWRVNNISPILSNFLQSIEKIILEKVEENGLFLDSIDRFDPDVIELN
jgi:DNA-binding transcriptional LysR family regulator